MRLITFMTASEQAVMTDFFGRAAFLLLSPQPSLIESSLRWMPLGRAAEFYRREERGREKGKVVSLKPAD